MGELMSAGSAVAVSPDWTYGGYPYGLEPLVLPQPNVADRPSTWHADAHRASVASLRGVMAGDVGSRPDAVEESTRLWWFRWITGHQVSFVLWRLIAQQVRNDSARPDVEASDEAMGRYLVGYAAMLLYSGSCTGAVYEQVIRPSMRLQHPSFSGGWAADYEPIRQLLHVDAAFDGRQRRSLRVRDAVRLQALAHARVAARLVPDGVSLLRQSAVGCPAPELAGAIYDNYFMTLRADVDRNEVVSQLLRRIVAVAQDVSVNGLYPSGSEETGAARVRSRPRELEQCEDDFGQCLLDVASSASELGME